MATSVAWRPIAAPRHGRGRGRKRAAAWLVAACLAVACAAGSPLQARQTSSPPTSEPAAAGAAASPAAQAPPAGSSSAEAPQAPAETREELTTVFRHPEGRLWVAGQVNFIFQGNLPFHSPYSGPHSLEPRAEHRLSRVITLYTGLRVGGGAEVLVDVESAGD